jgi:hypothetical protein
VTSVLFSAAKLGRGKQAISHRQHAGIVQRCCANGGRGQVFTTTPAEEVKMSADGKDFYQDKGGENIWRSLQRHCPGYLGVRCSSRVNNSPAFAGEDRNPVLTDNDKTIFISARS